MNKKYSKYNKFVKIISVICIISGIGMIFANIMRLVTGEKLDAMTILVFTMAVSIIANSFIQMNSIKRDN